MDRNLVVYLSFNVQVVFIHKIAFFDIDSYLPFDLSYVGSKNLYVSRAQKKAEREQLLHNQFEEKRKEQIQKSKVIPCPFSYV